MNNDEQCECCLLADQAHEHWCPYTEHPTWDSDPDPEARMRHEDLVYRDPREDERHGP